MLSEHAHCDPKPNLVSKDFEHVHNPNLLAQTPVCGLGRIGNTTACGKVWHGLLIRPFEVAIRVGVVPGGRSPESSKFIGPEQ